MNTNNYCTNTPLQRHDNPGLHSMLLHDVIAVSFLPPLLSGIRQSMLETVVPKATGVVVMVVRGGRKGQVSESVVLIRSFHMSCIIMEKKPFINLCSC